MFKKISNLFYNCKFKTKMLVSYLMISLIPVICIGFVSYLTAAELLNEQTVKWVTDYSEKDGAMIERSALSINNRLDEVVYDSDFMLLAKGVEYNNVSKDEISLFCNNLKQNLHNDDAAAVSVEFVFRIDYLNTDTSKAVKKVINDVSKSEYNSTDCLWYPSDRYIYVIRDIYDFYNSISVGKLVATFEKNGFFKSAVNNKSKENATIITFDDKQYAYVDFGNTMNTGVPPINVLHNVEKNKFIYNGMEYLTAQYQVKGTQFIVNGIIPYDKINKKISNIVITSTVTTFICACVVIALSFYMSYGLTRRIDQIIVQMKNVANGQFLVEFSDISGDEIGKLQTVFANLADRLDKLIKDNYQSKITQNELRLKALQAQINPHFLYNCLDNLNWHAIMSGDDRANHVITQLSRFYRTSLNAGNDITTVQNEMNNVVSYMNLQLDLHDNSFDFIVEKPDNIDDYLIVNLVLQPLLENAVNYGVDKIVDKDVRGKIVLTVLKNDDELFFTVRNNGPSISRNIAEKVLETKTKGYGLNNVNERVILFFGKSYGISIYPVKDGTECRLTVPAIYEYGGRTDE